MQEVLNEIISILGIDKNNNEKLSLDCLFIEENIP